MSSSNITVSVTDRVSNGLAQRVATVEIDGKYLRHFVGSDMSGHGLRDERSDAEVAARKLADHLTQGDYSYLAQIASRDDRSAAAAKISYAIGVN